MPLLDSIDSLVTDTVTIRRTVSSTYVDGVKVTGAQSTLTADVVMQPAFGLNRVVGGADLHGIVENQFATDVRDFFTRTEIKPLSQQYDADVIVGFEDADWTVARVERWPNLDGGHYWRAIITKQTSGSA
jgi:hypothetical protein